MKPLNKYAGMAGILTGALLLLEFAVFMASGFTPDKVLDPAQAIALVQNEEILLRIATFFGFTGAIISIPYIADWPPGCRLSHQLGRPRFFTSVFLVVLDTRW